MKITFVSNYINHHQLPVSNELNSMEDVEYCFVQTEKMEQDRINMGWGKEALPSYVKYYYDDEAYFQNLIMESDMVIFGGTDNEDYIMPRLEANKKVIRYSERIYKTGQWKFISPKGLKKKYHDHIRFNNSPVYLLCAGAYVASDFNLIHAYNNKMYSWGYFPEFKEYNIEEIIDNKAQHEKVNILWAGRMLDWKHPDDLIKAVAILKKENLQFELTMIGDGELRKNIEKLIVDNDLSASVEIKDFMKPEDVREEMLKTDIYCFTSDFYEGWGAVLNESMNSGCAVIASSGIGAVPYLLKHEKNGYVYKSGDVNELARYIKELALNKEKRRTVSLNAYTTIKDMWNPKVATDRLKKFIDDIIADDGIISFDRWSDGPISKAKIISPSKGYQYTRR